MLAIAAKLRFPPCWYRSVAHDERGNPLTSRQIAERGGISRTQVDRISQLTSWETVPIGTADKYIYGTRINPFRLKRHIAFATRVQSATNPRIARSRNAFYFKRLNQIIGAKAKAKKAEMVQKAGGA